MRLAIVITLSVLACGSESSTRSDGNTSTMTSDGSAAEMPTMTTGDARAATETLTMETKADGPAPKTDMAPPTSIDGPTSSLPDAPTDRKNLIIDALSPCPENERCITLDGTGGTCHMGSCCLGCWDGVTCQTQRSIDKCGTRGATCFSCGWIVVNAGGFCRFGEQTSFRSICTETGMCSAVLGSSEQVKCCDGLGENCRTP